MRILYHYFKRGAAHLNVVIYVLLQYYGLPYLNQCTELGFVVFNEKLAGGITVDSGVESGHGYISHPNISIMASTHPDMIPVLHIDHVDYTNVLQSDTF